MPTYVYGCEACGKQFEQFQSFKEDPLTVCRCGVEGKVRRVIQPAGVVFKGSGWYINDSRGASSTAVSDKAEQADTGDKAVKPEQAAKADTGDKAAKPEQAAKAEKSEQPDAGVKAATSEKSTKREPSSSSAEA